MRYLKLVLKWIFGFILGVFLILIVNHIRINLFYIFSKDNYQEVFEIHGNVNGYVPQGLAYSSLYDVVLQTSYNSRHQASMLYVTDFSSGRLIKSLRLVDSDGNDNMKHVGGITTDDNTVWITNDYEVDEFSLGDIIDTDLDFIKPSRTSKLPNRGDFCLYHDGVLWIGDFYLKHFYDVPDNTPLLFAYTGDDYFNPDYVISLPKMVQGMSIIGDKFVFSQSYTYLILSSLSVYESPLSGSYDFYNLNGRNIPYYKFDRIYSKYKLPPMVEGIFYKDDSLYMLFESSADSYSLALPRINKLLKYKIDK